MKLFLVGLLTLAVILALLVANVSQLLAGPETQPRFPAAFYGSLTSAGESAPVGTLVCGRIDGVDKGCITTTQTGQYGGPGGGDPKLIVQSSAEDVGKAVVFTVKPPGRVVGTAQQATTYQPGEVLQLDLSLAALPALEPTPTPPPPTPTPVPTPRPSGGSGGGGSGSGGGGGVGAAAPAPAPGVVSEAKAPVAAQTETKVQTPSGLIQVVIPANALPPNLIGRQVEVEIKQLDLASVPPPPPGTPLVRAFELNTLVDGARGVTTFGASVRLVLLLTAADLAAAGGDPFRLSIVRHDSATGVFSPVPTTFEATPAPGQLVASVNSFSILGIQVLQPVVTPTPAPTPTPTPAPTPAPTSTGAPKPTPTPAPTATPQPTAPAAPAPTPTPPPTAPAAPAPTPTPQPTITPTLAPTPTPELTTTPIPTPTRTPEPTATPAPPPAATPQPTATPPPAGGLGTSAVVGIIVGVIAAIAVAAAVVLYLRRRRSA